MAATRWSADEQETSVGLQGRGTLEKRNSVNLSAEETIDASQNKQNHQVVTRTRLSRLSPFLYGGAGVK